MNDCLDPLPSDLATLTAKASHAAQLGLDTVDSIIARLEAARPRHEDGAATGSRPVADQLTALNMFVKTTNAKTATAHKDWSTAVNKFAKAVDKKFPGPPLPLFPAASAPAPPRHLDPILYDYTHAGSPSATSALSPPRPIASFSSPEAISALNETIALHLARIGAFTTLTTFLDESHTPAPDSSLLDALQRLHAILAELKSGRCATALEWVATHAEHDPDHDLEFELRKEEYIQLLLAGSDLSIDPAVALTNRHEREPLLRRASTTATAVTVPPSAPDPHVENALRYGGHHFRRLLTPRRADLISALLTAPIYMPFERLLSSPYVHLFADYAQTPAASSAFSSDTSSAQDGSSPSTAASLFAAAYLRSINLPKDSPLSVVTDIGGSGAMAKIQKVQAVMKEKKTEWSAVGELPVEIPLPTSHRYHSIFACPVSKEQATASNPPMLLPCGHVIARESLVRLARGTPTLKCPYCPVVSHVAAAVKVHF